MTTTRTAVVTGAARGIGAGVAKRLAQDDRFLVLPHPEVAGYYAARATGTDRWLAGMNKLQVQLEAEGTMP